MKTFNLIFVLFFIFCSSLSAQMKVDSIGRAKVGVERPNQDGDGIVSMMVFGKYGEYKAGGKISIGDFGLQSLSGWNVFIGEYGTTDTDQLWLHGKLGTYFTYSGGTPWAYYNPQISNYFTVNCQVKANGLVLTSDERLKKDIQPLSGSLLLLQQLKGVSYYLNNTNLSAKFFVPDQRDDLTEKERRDLAFFENREKELQNAKELQLGFLAQDLRKVFPELVSEDKEGMLSVDYIGLIPVIVESIKEQQTQIERLKEELAAAKGNAISEAQLRSSTGENNTTGISDAFVKQCVLYQNAPNPFSEKTAIKYFLSQDIQQAYICIFDMQGKLLKKINAPAGENALIIKGSELHAGMYLYSLIAEGKEVDTKRMILTK